MNNITRINNIVDSISWSLRNDNHFAALTNSLILIDICSKVYRPQETTNYIRYQAWINDFLIPNLKDLGERKVYLSAENIWYLRNAMLHQGSSDPTTTNSYQRYGKKKVKDIVPTVFLERNKYKVFAADHGEEYPTLFFDIYYFCESILEAVIIWIVDNKDIFEDSDIRLFSIANEIPGDNNKVKIVRL